jgi:NAD(P)-dependent dehydrogenase (short-subunit alcohol dehydrogenase family)
MLIEGVRVQIRDGVAVVTGGGSGIGRALSLELSRRGASVVVTDVNAEAAARVATECGGGASSQHLDVRDAEAFTRLVASTVGEKGRVDFLFNNAGMGVAGEMFDLSPAHWERIIAVNLGGTVNGIAAVYPLMIRQRSGHIVNTASLAGLGPAPLFAPYAATKHAVVGLSRSLRLEAERYGVRVSVLCPGAIETPILSQDNPADLPAVRTRPDVRRFLTRLSGRPYPVEKMARETLDAVERNVSVIVLPASARLSWRLGRWAPSLVEKILRKELARERAAGQGGEVL